MKKIKSKIALVLALACFTSSAFGEESGLFLGLGFGAHGAKQSIRSTKLLDENGLKIRAMQSATDFGGAYYFGYKHIFDEHSGLRVYLNSESNNVEVEKSNGESTIRSYNIFGLGVDYLFNIIPNFGLFVGINSVLSRGIRKFGAWTGKMTSKSIVAMSPLKWDLGAFLARKNATLSSFLARYLSLKPLSNTK